MHIINSQKINNNIRLSIVEIDNPIIQKHCSNRYQVIIVKNNENIFPKNKEKFFCFEDNDYIYTLQSDLTGKKIQINPVLFHELAICDKTYEECTTLINELMIDNTKLNQTYFN